MPKREDERNLDLSSRHPAYCTCTVCTDRLLKRKGIKESGQAEALERLKALHRKPWCGTCNPQRPKRGLLNRLFRKG